MKADLNKLSVEWLETLRDAKLKTKVEFTNMMVERSIILDSTAEVRWRMYQLGWYLSVQIVHVNLHVDKLLR